MTEQSMSCERAVEENYSVIVGIPRSLEERRVDFSRRCVHCVKEACHVFCPVFFWIFRWTLAAAIFITTFGLIGTWLDCLFRPPSVSLEDVNIHDMVVYQNATGTPYQVRSELSVNLTASNHNTEAICFATFTTFLRMVVTVEFKGQQIVRQEVPLGFGLKQTKSRTMMLDLRGDGYPLKKESALLLDLELRNASGMGLTFSFESRVMNSCRKARWIRKTCDTIMRTPPNGTFSQTNSTSGLAWSLCEYA